MNDQGKHRDNITIGVRVSAALVVVFLVAFFVITVNNMVTISDEVEDMKEGPFPTSVAAGHIETDIAQIQTLVVHVTHFRNNVAHMQQLQVDFNEIDDNLTEQLAKIDPDALMEPADAAVLQAEHESLSAQITTVMNMLDDQSISNFDVTEYVNTQVMPLADNCLMLANQILRETTQKVDATHQVVEAACIQTIVFAVVLMVCIVLLICFYLVMLRRKTQQSDQLRENLEVALSEARRANAAKSEFLSNMSHDIRTPMNAIIGLTTIADDNIDNQLRVKQCLTRIMTSSKHLLSLINDVLDMNKIESGKTTLSEERFSVPSLVAEITSIVQPQSSEKNLQSDIIINDIHHEELIGDEMRLRQILLNLMSNAIKYTEPGGELRMILAEDTPTRPGFANLQIVVEDTGIGMDKEFLKHVFEPFECENNDATIFTEGTGLGMAITKNLVDLMGGTINVESEPGRGTKFTLCIPLKVPKDVPELPTDGFDQLHILVVDDNYLIMQDAIHTLSDFGVRVEGTTAPEDAAGLVVAARVAGRAFDMVIVDMEMPRLNGEDTVRQIHEAAGENVPIVVIASYGFSGRDASGSIDGVSAFVTKPLFRSRLYEVVRKLCIDGDAMEQTAEIANHAPISGRVLLVDDNEINLEIGLELISKLGPEAEGAEGGLQALVRVSDAPDGFYDLIFMDCKMPHMDGFETTQAIRRFLAERGREQIPIVAMTANAFEEDKKHAFDAGMDGFMSKPIDMGVLEATLREYL